MAGALEEPDTFLQQFVSAYLLDDYFGVAAGPKLYPPTPPDLLLPPDSTSEMVEALLATLAFVIARPLFSCVQHPVQHIR